MSEHRVGSIENDRDGFGDLTGKLAIRCVCGWKVRFSAFRAQSHEASSLALDHQLGRIETRATTGFLPVVDLTATTTEECDRG